LKGGENTLAISRERKNELVSQYVTWINRSQAVIVSEYAGLTMKQIDDLRSKIRAAGGEFHIMKNTLGRVAFKEAGLELPAALLEGSSAVAFAFQDAPAMAKTMADFARTSDAVNIKGGFLAKQAISTEGVKALAELPPLPVMRAMLLGTILAPASRLVRTLAEPGRSLAAVIQAHVDQESAPAAA
jgi:large subunit ribosomal protein L10